MTRIALGRRAVLAAPMLLAGVRAAGPDAITVAYGQTTLYNSPMWIAKERDLFGKYGLKAEPVQLTGSRITQGLLARSVEFIASSVSSPFLANLSGGDVQVVGATLKRLPWDFVVGPTIAGVGDIKGKVGGLALRGDLTETAILLALQTHDIPAKDVTLIQGFGTDAERIAALLSGSVAFTVVDADYRPQYEKAGVKRLFSMMDVPKPFLVSAIITTRAVARAKPDMVKRYLMAISEALVIMHADKDYTLQVAGQYSQRPPAEISPSYDIYIPYIQRIPIVEKPDVVSSLEALANVNPAAREADPASYFDPSYVDALVAAGFYRQIGAENRGQVMRVIDFHSHWGTEHGYRLRSDAERGQQPTVWKSEVKYETESEMADTFRRQGVRAILDLGFTKSLPISETVAFHDYAFAVQREHPDAILGHWINIDPRPREEALAELQRCRRTAPGFLGFMVSGGSVGVPASDPMFDPFYQWCARENVPVLILVGYTGTGAGLPGGSGVRLQNCHPLHVDDVAARFADLRIVAGRPAWPWQDDMIAILLHKANVWYELHGWSPKHFTAGLKHDIPRRLKNRVMFGADYPLFTYERLFADWAALGYSDAVMEGVYWRNAETFLHLAAS